MTEKLYDLDSYVREFDAVVTACRSDQNGLGLVLDRTAFFPEGGGQSSDIGEIDGYRVTDVRIKDNEIIHYISSAQELTDDKTAHTEELTEQSFPAGKAVHGKINWEKRFERMQQHSGEHLLSGYVFSDFGYHNTGFHLSNNGTTVDFDGTFTESDIERIEDAVNRTILRNVPCHIFYPSPEELSQLTYRSKKELEGPVRIVEFYEDVPVTERTDDNEVILYDRCACCAPHVRSTIEIGLFKILSFEHFKGGTRMEIACGGRLLREIRVMQENVTGISRLLSVKPENAAQGVIKLNDSFKALKFNYIRIERELLDMTAQQAGSPVLFLESADTANVRMAVNALTLRFPDDYCCAFVGNDEKGYNFIVASSKDCSEFLSLMRSELSASGGGSRSMIQGNVKASRKAIEAFILNRKVI